MIVVALILGVNFANRIKPHFKNDLLPNLAGYIQYVVEDIGTPPNLSRAKTLALELPFELRIEGDDIEWSSQADIQPIDRYRLKRAPAPYQNYLVGSQRNHHFLAFQTGEYRYLFLVDNEFRRHQGQRHWVLFLLLGSTLVILYLVIRRLFRPIKLISQQVQRIGDGMFDQSIELHGNDELTKLAAGVNAMSLQIKSMLESKAGLLLALSHELRSPITRMRVNLELLDESSPRNALIDDIVEMESLISNILETEKLNTAHAPLNLTCCDLAKLIEAAVDRYFATENINLNLAPAEGKFDEFRFKLLVKNLLDNALRYSVGYELAIDISLSKQNGQIILVITDHGSGIAEQELERITQPFYRTDRARQRSTGGYGLGLYLCQLIVDAHGGKMAISSKSGAGTTVRISFPDQTTIG
jgi:signal transduction histidine kinase